LESPDKWPISEWQLREHGAVVIGERTNNGSGKRRTLNVTSFCEAA
jgi:hypothetical protein